MLGYSAANACMKQLSTMPCVSTWAICNKELITVVAVGPWLLWQAWRRRSGFPTGRPLAILVAVGLATELIGNIGVQWGYEIVGLAVMVPAYTGFHSRCHDGPRRQLAGRAGLRAEPGGSRIADSGRCLAGGCFRASRPALSRQTARQAPWLIVTAIAVAAAAGIVFSLLGIAIRHCVTGATSHIAVVVIITVTGVLTLGPLSFASAGAAKLMATPWEQYALMFAAGICNLIAFLALVRGLHLTTVLHVNMINAGQVAMAAMVGVFFFGENCNHRLVLGVGLMIVGIFAFGTPVDQEAVDAHV